MASKHRPAPILDTNGAAYLTAGQIISRGVRKALSGAIWVYKILIPISFLTMLINFTGVLAYLDGFLAPLMGLLHLPAKAAMPLLAGFLTGIYGGVASMAVLDLTSRETVFIAVFLLISHNMIQESAVQGNAGINPVKAAMFRLSASVIVVWLLGLLWSDNGSSDLVIGLAGDPQPTAFMTQLVQWCWQTLMLCAKILLILLGIMTAVTWMKARCITQRIVRYLTPVLKVMGLDSGEGLLWLTAVLFGVTYGSAVIIEETRQGHLTRQELERLHLSIGINHAMIEDPALFLPLGVHPFWLWVPRLVAAILAVRLLRVFRLITRKRLRIQPIR